MSEPLPGATRPVSWGTCAGHPCDNDAVIEVFIWPNYPSVADGCAWVPLCAYCKERTERGASLEYIFEAHGFLSGYTQTAPGGPMTANEGRGVDLDAIRELIKRGHASRSVTLHPGTVASMVRELDRLRAAGLLPGPDDIVVSREALEIALEHDHRLGATSECSVCKAKATLRAALSQPHPAQEQQT